jgi:hypothetical protein
VGSLQARTWGSTGVDYIEDLQIDAQGQSLYGVGMFEAPIDFGSTRLSPVGARDAWVNRSVHATTFLGCPKILKYDSQVAKFSAVNGSALW